MCILPDQLSLQKPADLDFHFLKRSIDCFGEKHPICIASFCVVLL